MTGNALRPERGSATRELILETAERLFAEHGIHVVSNRQVSEAAGQGNSAAVSYHFGSKTELVRAIASKHTEQMERLRMHMVADVAGSTDLRDWVACMVRPFTGHLANLGSPTWCARFLVQATSDPTLHRIVSEDAFASPSRRLLLASLNQCLPELPGTVRAERSVMARHLIAQMSVEQERALAEGAATVHPSWEALGTSLIDALVGLWQAPVVSRP
jgi:AcrR family transcriptional regulator